MKNLMYRLGAVAFLSFVIGATSVAYAASFDCSKASNKVENLICNDAELSQLDEYMAKLYRETRRVQSDGPTHLNAQRVWLKQRNQCEHQECLRSSYQQRIDQLALLASLETGHEPANTPVTINKPLFAMKDEGAGVRKEESVDEITEAYKQFLLGHRYENGDGVPQDYMLAKHWYEKSAEKGFYPAQFNLGLMYANGQGISQDYMLAKQWIEKAAEQGLAEAQFNLGVIYAQGFGVRQDHLLAKQWYEKAAEQGNATAQSNLGFMYDRGKGVRQDYQLAKQWYEKAAVQGETKAQSNLGTMYAEGNGVRQDYQLARQWFEKAASQGEALAQFNLGLIYANGAGVRQNYAEAKEWFGKACDNGLQAGCDQYRTLNSK